jgi:hypothetical protein
MKLIRKRALVASLSVAAVAAFAAMAVASPPTPDLVIENLVAKADLNKRVRVNSDGIKLRTRGRTDVRVQTLTFPPGARTGWHHHPGIVIVAVQAGEVTVFSHHCKPRKYGPTSPNGAAFVESGDHPMEVRNTGAAPAKVYATFLAPNADPDGVFRIEDDVQTCA